MVLGPSGLDKKDVFTKLMTDQKTKGIILAGGCGKRLYPLTATMTKQLLPVYDKPLIYYPLSTLMLSGIRDIMIISTPFDLPLFQKLFQDGSHLGLNISYKEQKRPEGIAQALIIAKDFTKNHSVCLILGDNIFYGHKLEEHLQNLTSLERGAGICAYPICDPQRYGVIEFDKNNQPIRIIEKPKSPPSSYAVTGIYYYDHNAASYAQTLKPSARGELEITDLNNIYLQNKELHVEKLTHGIAWLDAGTPQSLLDAGNFIEVLEKRQGLKIACIEETAYRMKLISLTQLEKLAFEMGNNHYSQYLIQLVKNENQTR